MSFMFLLSIHLLLFSAVACQLHSVTEHPKNGTITTTVSTGKAAKPKTNSSLAYNGSHIRTTVNKKLAFNISEIAGAGRQNETCNGTSTVCTAGHQCCSKVCWNHQYKKEWTCECSPLGKPCRPGTHYDCCFMEDLKCVNGTCESSLNGKENSSGSLHQSKVCFQYIIVSFAAFLAIFYSFNY